jgi:hypothetical protein
MNSNSVNFPYRVSLDFSKDAISFFACSVRVPSQTEVILATESLNWVCREFFLTWNECISKMSSFFAI